MENAVDPTHRQKAIDFFKHECVICLGSIIEHQPDWLIFRFEIDYILAALKKPYVVIMDGITCMYRFLQRKFGLTARLQWVEGWD